MIRENLSCHRKKIRHPIFRQQCLSLGKIDWKRQFDTRFREAAARLFAVLKARGRVFFELSPEVLRVEVFLRMVEYRGQWLRQPEDWHPHAGSDPAGEVFSLIDHLFVRYPLPTYFRKAWMEAGPLRSRARDWFCQLTAGKSLRKLKDLPTRLSSRAAHSTMSAPASLTIEQALRYGQVIAFGGSEELATEIVRSRAGTDFRHDGIWLTLFEKLAGAPRFAAHEAPIVIDYIHFWILDHQGRSPARLLGDNHIIELGKRARRFWKETAERAATAYADPRLIEFGLQDVRNRLLRAIVRRWEPMQNVRPATIHGEAGREWHIDELCSELELQREGTAMHHCVASYSPDCLRGACSIWSAREEAGGRVATIRLHVPDLMLDEARAPFNEEPDRDTLQAIRTWARHHQVDDQWLDDEFGFCDATRLELIERAGA